MKTKGTYIQWKMRSKKIGKWAAFTEVQIKALAHRSGVPYYRLQPATLGHLKLRHEELQRIKEVLGGTTTSVKQTNPLCPAHVAVRMRWVGKIFHVHKGTGKKHAIGDGFRCPVADCPRVESVIVGEC